MPDLEYKIKQNIACLSERKHRQTKNVNPASLNEEVKFCIPSLHVNPMRNASQSLFSMMRQEIYSSCKRNCISYAS